MIIMLQNLRKKFQKKQRELMKLRVFELFLLVTKSLIAKKSENRMEFQWKSTRENDQIFFNEFEKISSTS